MEMQQPLQTFRLFNGLSQSDIDIIARLLQTRQYNAGAYLCLQGDAADTLFLIESGSVEVMQRVSDETSVRLAIRQEGDSIGEMTLIDDALRFASVRCLEPVRAKLLSRRDLNTLIDTCPGLFIHIMMNILREISLRLREKDRLSGSALFGRN